MSPSPTDSVADRRDSPRVPMRLLIRSASAQGDFREHDGDLSLGGVSFPGAPPQAGERFEVRFQLPNSDQALHVQAEPILREDSAAKGVQLRFVDLDTATELAIARYLDDLAGAAR